MASILARLRGQALAKHQKRIAAGNVLPIDRFVTHDDSFAAALSYGGALYLVSEGDDGELWLLAVLESPERSGLKKADRRPAGWYAPANTAPVTDLKTIKSKLELRGKLANALEIPIALSVEQEAMIRELVGDIDAPVIGVDVQVVVAPKLAGSPLENAASYLAGSHVVAAIEALKEAWRVNRVPELADLIDRATRVAPGYDRPLFDRRVREWNDNSPIWETTHGGDPVAAMPQLLQNLPIGGRDNLARRTELLAELPDDPRLGRRLAELIPIGPGQFNRRPKYWAPIIEIWLRGRDLRLCDAILEAKPQVAGPQATKVFALARKPDGYFKGKPPTLAAADRELITTIERELQRLEQPYRLECDLVETIAANPEDDANLQIYADQLQERGHPRGEYIALACQKHRAALTPALARRFEALAQLPYLCGPLDDLAIRRLRPHDRGLDRELQVSWKAMPITWLEVAAHPLARALRKIELVGEPLPHRADAIAAVVRVATKLARLVGIGPKAGKQVVAKVEGWKLEGDDLVRSL